MEEFELIVKSDAWQTIFLGLWVIAILAAVV